MKLFGLAGWSGSGKTTLMLGLIAELRRGGLRVATLKHSHHAVEIDEAGDDSRRLRAAGASEVLIAGARRWALFHDANDISNLAALVPRFADCDFLLIEGLKAGAFPKLEVFRPDLGKPLLCREDPQIVAIATAGPGPFPVPQFDPADIAGIAAFVINWP